jgi:ATP-dependent exoDNAse (exonuclease V) beta subunit
VRWRDPATVKAAPDVVHVAVTEEQKAARAEEDMRLLYVAMTRAEDHLMLSYASTERSRGSSWSALVEKRLTPAPVPAEEPAVSEAPSVEPPAEAPPEVVPKPPVSGQHDSSAPVTDIGLFLACPRRYYLSCYLGFPERPASSAPEHSAAAIGSEVHKMLAGTAPEECSAEARELAENFGRTPVAGRLDRADRIEREFGFRIEVEDVVLRGQIDLWFEEAGELVLVDYKTDRDTGERLEPHSLQLRLYALALERLTGRLPDLAVLSFLRTEREIQVPLGEDSLASAREAVREFREAQEAMAFPPREGAHCRGCGFHAGMCPVGR